MTKITVPTPRKLPSGNWFIQVRSHGQSQSFTHPNKAQCIAMASAYKSGIISIAKDENPLTLTQAIDEYIEDRSKVLSPSTIRCYRHIQKYRFGGLMEKRVDKITRSHCQKAVNLEADIIAAKTLKNAWGLISAVLKDAGQNKIEVRLPQIVVNEHPFLSAEEIPKFLEAIHGSTAETIALLALHSLRRSEIAALTWHSIDIEKAVIHVNGAVVPDENNNLVKKRETKNQTSRRTVPIFIPRLLELLTDGKSKSHNLDHSVSKIATQTAYNNINNICKANNFPLVGIHGLRHSFASLAYHLELPPKVAMQIGGWANDQTMIKIYTHISKADVHKHTATLSSFFNANNS